MHIFTSITANYLPKAAALAISVKRLHPEAVFHVVLCDELPPCPSITTGAFDSIINIKDLPIDNLPSWIFKHRLVELCTAVKGTAFQHIADRFGAERIYYFDPDIVVLGRLDALERKLDSSSILLTPHLAEPETLHQAILDNELCALRHGIYNLGFLAVRVSSQGRRFIDWWADRLRQFCYDDVKSGLFTDQRWVDLAPAYFDDIAIVREPEFNVATWNLTHRRATGTAPYEIRINDRPLVFYHFSGFDSGAQRACSIATGRRAPYCTICATGTSRGAGSLARKRWVPSTASLTHSRAAGESRMRTGWSIGAATIWRSTFRTRLRRAVTLTSAGSSFTARPSGCGHWSGCSRNQLLPGHFRWPARPVRHGGAGRSRREGYPADDEDHRVHDRHSTRGDQDGPGRAGSASGFVGSPPSPSDRAALRAGAKRARRQRYRARH